MSLETNDQKNATPTPNTRAVYVSATRLTKQTTSSDTWANEIVIMNSVLESHGIEYNANTGICTLNGGVTYRITAQLGWQGSTSENYKFGLFNAEDNIQVGSAAGSNGSTLDVIYTPPADLRYYLKMLPDVEAPDSSYIHPNVGTFLNIVVLPDVPASPTALCAGLATNAILCIKGYLYNLFTRFGRRTK
jgi:hypothetical protein